MTKIDWDKPLREVGGDKTAHTFIGKDPESGVYWVRLSYEEMTASYAYWKDGTAMIPGHPNLENIPEPPQEPEREEGLYWVKWHGNRDYYLAHFLNSEWHDQAGNRTSAPVEIGPRDYTPHEFRPADKCPPPMDGTPFEVEGHTGRPSIRLMLDYDEYRLEFSTNSDSFGLTWLYGKRWRPVQP